MAESIQEDVYSLGQAKDLIKRMHDDYVRCHPTEVDGEKYKHHLKEIVGHLDDAMKERQAHTVQEGILWRWQ